MKKRLTTKELELIGRDLIRQGLTATSTGFDYKNKRYWINIQVMEIEND